MATVHLPSGWTEHTGGADAIVVDAVRVVDLIAQLTARFPALRDHLQNAAVAIDGRIYHHAEYEPLSATSEVYLLPPVGGG